MNSIHKDWKKCSIFCSGIITSIMLDLHTSEIRTFFPVVSKDKEISPGACPKRLLKGEMKA